jgi:hypothetical protein
MFVLGLYIWAGKTTTLPISAYKAPTQTREPPAGCGGLGGVTRYALANSRTADRMRAFSALTMASNPLAAALIASPLAVREGRK